LTDRSLFIIFSNLEHSVVLEEFDHEIDNKDKDNKKSDDANNIVIAYKSKSKHEALKDIPLLHAYHLIVKPIRIVGRETQAISRTDKQI
jgi:hypothetical protein